jgi:hypothetical protein
MNHEERRKLKKEEDRVWREKRAVVAERTKAKFSELISNDDLSGTKHLRSSRYEEVSHELSLLTQAKTHEVIQFSTLIRYGNPFANLVSVDSYLQPRHVRWTVLFLDLLLIWFFSGMYLKNTRSI